MVDGGVNVHPDDEVGLVATVFYMSLLQPYREEISLVFILSAIDELYHHAYLVSSICS